MKKILFILILLIFIGCSENDNAKYYCTQGTIRILNKDRQPCSRGGGYCAYNFYLFDGNSAYWSSTNRETWEKYDINDTLPTIVITKIVTIIKEK